MKPKDLFTNTAFCPMPWTGLMYNVDGQVKNCIRSAGTIGNLNDKPIRDILLDRENIGTQRDILDHTPGKNCYPCHDIERGKKNLDIISDRIFYIRELKKVSLETYSLGNHELHTIDIRWTNLCNFACVYCGPEFSSRWAKELDISSLHPPIEREQDLKKYIFDRAPGLKHVYMAGGEPLLMKQNLELLEILWDTNPDVQIRINTNLSKMHTRIFDKVCEFKNVHWTISVESMDREFEYIRYGGKWSEFLENLAIVKSLSHKVTFNMLYFLLNFRSLFDTIKFLQRLGYHNNSFVVGALISPDYLNIRHLPDSVLQSIKSILEIEINGKPGFLLEDSLRNLRYYLDRPMCKNLAGSFEALEILDQRRNLDSRKIFTELYSYQHKEKSWPNHLM